MREKGRGGPHLLDRSRFGCRQTRKGWRWASWEKGEGRGGREETIISAVVCLCSWGKGGGRAGESARMSS